MSRWRRGFLWMAAAVLVGIVAITFLGLASYWGLTDKTNILGSILSVLIGSAALCMAIYGAYRGRIEVEGIPQPKFVPSNIVKIYLRSFLAIERSPPWDRSLCESSTLARAKLRYTPRLKGDPPVYSHRIEETGREELVERTESISRIIRRIIKDRSTTHVILGEPGSGKSSFALQLAHRLASLAHNGTLEELPVYVNLAHFDESCRPNLQGLESLIKKSIALSCPRHLHKEALPDRPLATFAHEIVHGHRYSVVFILDGIDEMPIDAENAQVKAIGKFIDTHSDSRFLVTCRFEDYQSLTPAAPNTRIERWDILPWTEAMARKYLLEAFPKDKSARERILRMAEDNRRSKNLPGFSPLEISLLVEARPRQQVTVSELFDSILLARLRPTYPNQEDARKATVRLAKEAFAQVWYETSFEIDRETVDAAERASIARDAPGGLRFEIRPLLHHLAGRELLRRLQEKEPLPKSVRLDDINLRDIFQSTSTQAGADTAWTQFVADELTRNEDEDG